MTAVRCVDLCKTYRQGEEDIKALDHVSIEIAEGGFVCLSAPSGGGKTTLLNAIGGLDKPDSGEVYVAERRIDNLYTIARARSAGMNRVFYNRGYRWTGTLVNNCHIAGDFEDMHVWCKSVEPAVHN